MAALTPFSPGIGVFSAAWGNFLLQGGALYADLKAYTPPVAGASVFMIGTTAPNDGGQGFFVWNSTVIATDDNGLTAIVPNGASQGAWLRDDPRPKITAFVTVTDFGATGVCASGNDDTAAIQAAINASLNVFFPPGCYNISSAITLKQGSQIWGAGNGATTITMLTAGQTGFDFTLAAIGDGDITIRDLGITSAATANGATGIHFQLAENTLIQNIAFQGVAANIIIDRGRGHVISDCSSEGNLNFPSGQLKIWSSIDTDYCFYPSVENYYVNTGIFDTGVVKGSVTPAIYLRRTIQARLNNCNIDHGEIGTPCGFILLENDSQGTKIFQGSSHGCVYGVLIQTGNGVQVGPGYTSILDHDVDLFSTAGIWIATSSPGVAVLTSIIGGKITAASAIGASYISISNLIDGTVTGVHCEDYSGSKNGTGLRISADVTMQMSDCIFDQMNIGWDFTGGALVNCTFMGNALTNCNTPIATPANIAGGSNAFSHNRGYDPPTTLVTTPPVPASGVFQVNNTGFDVMVYPSGGTGVAWSVNAVSLGSSTGPFYLPANGLIAASYSGAPTWIWVGI